MVNGKLGCYCWWWLMKKIVEVKCLGNTIRTALRLSVENYDGIHIAVFIYYSKHKLLMHTETLALLPIAGSAC